MKSFPLLASSFQRFSSLVGRFFSSPSSTLPFACLRIGTALVLLAKLWVEASTLLEVYGNRGLVRWVISGLLLNEWAPRLSGLADVAASYGIGEDQCVYAVVMLYALSLLGLLVGWQSRFMAMLAWFAHLTLSNSGAMSVYGVDTFANIALFYCFVVPVGDALSLDKKFAPPTASESATSALPFLRLLQIHVCIVYLASGLEKASGSQWWNGEAIWRAVMQPQFRVLDMSWLAGAPWVAQAATIGTLVIEIGYCIFIWPRRTRSLWLLATIGLHASIALLMGLWLFACIMIVLNLAAFGSDLIDGCAKRFTAMTFGIVRRTSTSAQLH